MARTAKTGIVITALDKASPVLGKIGRAAQKLSGGAKKAFAAMGKAIVVVNQATQFMKTVFNATFGVVLKAFSAGLDASMKFGNALREVSTLVDSSKTSTASLNGTIQELAVSFGQMPVEQAKGLYMAISSGAQAGAQATTLMTAANKMAIGGVTSVDKSIDALTTVINSFGVSFYDAEAVSDKFFTTIKLGKTTATELASGIGMVSTSAAAAGMKMDEMFTIIAASTKVGLNTAKSTVGLNAAITSIVKPSKDATAEAKRLGIEWDAAALRSKGLVGILKEVAAAEDLTDTSLGKLIPSVRAARIATAVMNNNFKEVNMIMPEMARSLSATDVAFNKMIDTVDHQIRILGVMKEKTTSSFGDMMKEAPTFKRGVIIVQRHLRDLEKWFQSRAGGEFAERFWKSLADLTGIFLGALETMFSFLGSMGIQLGDDLAKAARKMKDTVSQVTGNLSKEAMTHEQLLRKIAESNLDFVAKNARLVTYQKKKGYIDDKGNLIKTEASGLKTIEKMNKSFIGRRLGDAALGAKATRDVYMDELASRKMSINEIYKHTQRVGQARIDHLKNRTDTERKMSKREVLAAARVASNVLKDDRMMEKADREQRADEKAAADKRTNQIAAKTKGEAAKHVAAAAEAAAAKLAKKEFAADAELQTKIRTQAMNLMESRMSGIEAMDLKGTAKKEMIEKHKLQIVKRFKKHEQSVATKGTAAAIKNYKTEQDIKEGLYAKDLAAQTQTVSLAAAGWGERLNTFKEMGLKELDLLKAKEAAKRAILAGTEEHLKKNVEKGIQLAEKTFTSEEALAKKAAAVKKKEGEKAVRYAEQIGNAVYGLGRDFVTDLMDDEVTATQAWKNMGNAALTMILETGAQYVITEGLKAAARAAFTTTVLAADATETVAGVTKETALTTAAVIGTSGRIALKSTEAAASIASSAGSGGAGVWEFFASWGPIGWAIAAVASIALVAGILAYNDMLPGMAQGGYVSGGVAGKDSVPAMLMPGEYVLNKSTVDSIRRGAAPTVPGHYAQGGLVHPSLAGSGGVVFAPVIQTIALPNAVQNQRYYRDTVARTRNRLNSNGFSM